MVTPNKPYVSEPMEADLYDSFDTIKILLSTLGLPIFQPARVKKSTSTEQDDLIFFISRKGFTGKGIYTEEGFVVLAGSKFDKTVTNSLNEAKGRKREQMLKDGLLVDKGKYYGLVEDLIFGSPSTAGASVTGRSTNGWTAWKLENGKTLSDIYRSKEK